MSLRAIILAQGLVVAAAFTSARAEDVPIPTPLAYHGFGGWKASAFGDLNQHGTDAIRFWTRTKTVTSRWPSGIKEGAEFQMPVME